jgi:hypothetical protein
MNKSISNAKQKQTNILKLPPIQLLDFEYRQDGQINVLVPRFKNVFFQKLIPKNRNPYIKANLDEIGSAAWELIDGKRTVTEIAVILEEKFKEQIAPVYERLALFVQKMNANKFITFIEFTEK